MTQMIFKSEEERTTFQKANADARKKIAKEEADKYYNLAKSFTNIIKEKIDD